MDKKLADSQRSNAVTSQDSEPQIISPEVAEEILDREIEKMVEEGWRVKVRSVAYVRMMQERDILDIRVDLLGNIEKEQGVALLYGPDVGRMVAWMVLIAWLLVVLVFATVIGFI
jgi:hypothetical protein